MIGRFLILSSLLFLSIGCKAQNDQRKEINPASGDIITEIALDNLGLPYISGTLEEEPEHLIINTDKTDCILFVEMCVATLLSDRSGDPFEASVQKLRYRNGIIDGYCSRLHYTSEWVQQGIENSIFTDRTESLGGISKTKLINYMSYHPDSYQQLKNDMNNVSKIMAIEAKISQYQYCEIPKNSVAAIANEIHNGDLIMFMTSVAGLDISHVGIAYWNKGKLTFIHASSKAGKVIINPEPLSTYLQNQKSISGIRIIQVN